LFGRLTDGGIVLVDCRNGDIVFDFQDGKSQRAKKPEDQETA